MKMKKDQKSQKSSASKHGHNSSGSGSGEAVADSDRSDDHSDDNSEHSDDEQPRLDYRAASAANHARCGHHGGHGPGSGAFHSHATAAPKATAVTATSRAG